MTDQPGHPDKPEPDGTDAGASSSGTPGPGAAHRPSAFEAAFEGESWDRRRRRRSEPSSERESEPLSEPPTERPARGREPRRSARSAPPAGATLPDATPQRQTDSSQGSRSRASRRTRRVRSVLLHVVLGVLGLGLAWIVVTGLLAAYQLNQARSDLSSLRSQITSGGADVNETADAFAAHAHHAAVLTRGPAWSVLAAIPYVGDPADAVRGITTQTSALADGALPGVLAAAEDVNPRTVLQAGAVDLAAVQRASGPVHEAAAAVDSANANVANLPDHTWLPFVDSATGDLGSQLSSLGHTLHTTDQALQVLPTMLGGDGRTRRYFVAFQNNAELRGTGGLPGAFAIVAATNGKVSIERFESDDLLAGTVPSGLDFGKAYNAHYEGDMPYDQYIDSNESPHFPYAAQIWCAMWKNVSGEQLDGAVTVDPGALSYLLAATGPATAPDGTSVTADNVVALLQKDVYAKFPEAGENADRKQYILGVASAVEKKILTGAKGGRGLLQGLAKGVSERRIVAWSADQKVQAVLSTATIGGTVATTTEPYSLLSLNGAAGKLDYYLGRSVTWKRTGCGDTRDVTVTITLTNNAPASGLPAYVTTRRDDPTEPTVPGQNRVIVDYVATTGAQLLGTKIDGVDSGAAVFDEEGHPTYRTSLELKPGQSRTWVISLQEPAGNQPVTVVKQTGVLPLDVTVDDATCR